VFVTVLIDIDRHRSESIRVIADVVKATHYGPAVTNRQGLSATNAPRQPAADPAPGDEKTF
jgi:hypothetical protein